MENQQAHDHRDGTHHQHRGALLAVAHMVIGDFAQPDKRKHRGKGHCLVQQQGGLFQNGRDIGHEPCGKITVHHPVVE